ncbi:hypothetical protein BVC93_25085 [Mycobacterium sp. MS1601]|uniref:three-helix bundle dimerization domain-containing protein n=1 Tax=Mycobacterium sp. MS1601 TaxID=1936029 RepID=UPI000979513B|nr:hypothetical protein [Mycobacterium sp. MS1601]AQA05134.1 hypothetical protein BVC93_25085 [Mycobacterium sp. MS1601]
MLIENVPVQPGGSSTVVFDNEIDEIITAVCAKFPACSRAEVESVVVQAYRHLADRATVTAHLIPLTLNRSVRVLRRAHPSPRCTDR